MIKPYIQGIHSEFLSLVKNYKALVALVSKEKLQKTEELVTSLEEIYSTSFSDNLRTFLNWSCALPIYGAPFYKFVDGVTDVMVWTHQAEIIKIYRDKAKNENKHKLTFLHGEFALEGKLIFEVFVDTSGEESGKKEAIYVTYGKEKEGYSYIFEDENSAKTLKVADSILDFCKDYLAFLRSLPRVKNPNKKLEQLLVDPTKLFQFVETYNWDNGLDILEEIAKDPRCDKATALLLYWLSQPYAFDQDLAVESNLLPIIIENNIKNDFYADSENHFDPSSESEKFGNFLQEYSQVSNKAREIPEFMLSLSF